MADFVDWATGDNDWNARKRQQCTDSTCSQFCR